MGEYKGASKKLASDSLKVGKKVIKVTVRASAWAWKQFKQVVVYAGKQWDDAVKEETK